MTKDLNLGTYDSILQILDQLCLLLILPPIVLYDAFSAVSTSLQNFRGLLFALTLCCRFSFHPGKLPFRQSTQPSILLLPYANFFGIFVSPFLYRCRCWRIDINLTMSSTVEWFFPDCSLNFRAILLSDLRQLGRSSRVG